MKNIKKPGKIFLALCLVLGLWISWDIFRPTRSDITKFDPLRVGSLEMAMWRSYYEKKPMKLFLQLSETLRTQFKAPFWRSFQLAYYAAKAALIFQQGTSREEYRQALPYLEKYYAGIQALSDTPFDVSQVATDELEWWVIRREPALHQPSEWEQLIAQIAAALYQVPTEAMAEHASLRVSAMRLRDQKGRVITEEDWDEIERLLKASWQSLHTAVNEDKKAAIDTTSLQQSKA